MDARAYYTVYGKTAWRQVCRRAGVHWWQAWAFAARRQRPNPEVAIRLAGVDPQKRLDALALAAAPIDRKGVVPRNKRKAA
jgi:hypothetical protein